MKCLMDADKEGQALTWGPCSAEVQEVERGRGEGSPFLPANKVTQSHSTQWVCIPLPHGLPGQGQPHRCPLPTHV